MDKADASALAQVQEALEGIAAFETETVSAWDEAEVNAYLGRKKAAFAGFVAAEKDRIVKAAEKKMREEAEAELNRQLAIEAEKAAAEKAKKEAEEKERKAKEAEERAKREAELAAKKEVERKKKEEEEMKRREAAIARGEDPDAESEEAKALRFGQAAALDKERTEASMRIPKNPGTQKVDLTDPAILDTFIRMRNDEDPLRWMILAYKEGSKNVLMVHAKGEGGFDEMVQHIPDDACFIYINYAFGDTNRSKFCFLTYVPESLAGLAKSRVVGHRPHVEKFLKYYQVGWHVLSKPEFVEKTLVDMLLKAGGANYSVQEEQKGDFSSYKKTTKEFYSETEKKGRVDIVYDQGPLMTTPVDISGRASVAPPTDFQKNTSSDFKGKKADA